MNFKWNCSALLGLIVVFTITKSSAQCFLFKSIDTTFYSLSKSKKIKRIEYFRENNWSFDPELAYTLHYNRRGLLIKKVVEQIDGLGHTTFDKGGLVRYKYDKNDSLVSQTVYKLSGELQKRKAHSFNHSINQNINSLKVYETNSYSVKDIYISTRSNAFPVQNLGSKELLLKYRLNLLNGTGKVEGILPNGWSYKGEAELHVCERSTEIDSVLQQFQNIPYLHDSDLKNKNCTLFELLQKHGAFEAPQFKYENGSFTISYKDTSWKLKLNIDTFLKQGLDTPFYNNSINMHERYYNNWIFPFYLTNYETNSTQLVQMNYHLNLSNQVDEKGRLLAERYYVEDVGYCMNEYFQEGKFLGKYVNHCQSRHDTFMIFYDTINNMKPKPWVYDENYIYINKSLWKHAKLIAIDNYRNRIDTSISYYHSSNNTYCTVVETRVYITKINQDSFEHCWFNLPKNSFNLETLNDSLFNYKLSKFANYKKGALRNPNGTLLYQWPQQHKAWADIRPWEMKR
ncbi:MAG: hypothetical protein JXQ87_18120 [Bacteroidia bacterium]